MKIIFLLTLALLTGCSPIRVLVEQGSTAEVHIHTHDAGILGITQPTAEQVKTGEGDVQFPGLIDGVKMQRKKLLETDSLAPKAESMIDDQPEVSLLPAEGL